MTTEVLTWKGRRVPWVTRWTEEQVMNASYRIRSTARGLILVFADGQAFGRDKHGVMWYPDGVGRGGEPMWSDVHAFRHRRCMLDPRCQVCGDKLTGPRIPWLFSKTEWASLGDSPLTVTPPTCENCWDTARLQCPHLRKHDVVPAYVESIQPWGVQGDLSDGNGALHSCQQIPYGSRQLLLTVAKQLVVEVVGFQEAER